MSNAYVKNLSQESFSLSDGTTLIHRHLYGGATLVVPICEVPGPYGPLSLSLMWRSDVDSNYAPSCQFGHGWFLNVGQRLIVSVTAVHYIDGAADHHEFDPVAPGGVSCDRGGSGLLLRQLSGGGYEIFDGISSRVLFDSNGRLSSYERHMAGAAHATQITYDNAGKPTAIADSSGRALSLSFGASGCSIALPDLSTVTVTFYSGEFCMVERSTGEQVEIELSPFDWPVSAENEDGEVLAWNFDSYGLCSILKKRGDVLLFRRSFSRDTDLRILTALTLVHGRAVGNELAEIVHMDQTGRRVETAFSQNPFPIYAPDDPYEDFVSAPTEQNSRQSTTESFQLIAASGYAEESIAFPSGSLSTSGDEELRLSLLVRLATSLPGPISLDILSQSGVSLLPDGALTIGEWNAAQFLSFSLRLTASVWQTSLKIRVTNQSSTSVKLVFGAAALSAARKSGALSIVKVSSGGEYQEPGGSGWSRVRSAAGAPQSGGTVRFYKEDLLANSLLLLRGSPSVFAERMTKLVPASTPTSVNGGTAAAYDSFTFGTLRRSGQGTAFSYARPANASLKSTADLGQSHPRSEETSLAFNDYCLWPTSLAAAYSGSSSMSSTKTYSYGQDGLLASERLDAGCGSMLRSQSLSQTGSQFELASEDWGGVQSTEKTPKATGLLQSRSVALGAAKEFTYGQRERLIRMEQSIWMNRVEYAAGLPSVFRLSTITEQLKREYNADGTLLSEKILDHSPDTYSYSYLAENKTTVCRSYANGGSESAKTDARGLIVERTADQAAYSYSYTGNLLTQVDENSSPIRTLQYDAQSRLTNDSNRYWLTYDGYGYVVSQKIVYPDYSSISNPQYDPLGQLTYDYFGSLQGTCYAQFARDALGREISARTRLRISGSPATYGPDYKTAISYKTRVVGNETVSTPLPLAFAYSLGSSPDGSRGYEYDTSGRVTEVFLNGQQSPSLAYQYGGGGRLLREDNAAFGLSWKWAYNTAGDITSKKEYQYQQIPGSCTTKNYSYSSGRLTAFGSETIGNYDLSDNPGSWRGAALTYCRGHLAASWSKSGKVLQFSYDDEGRITERREQNSFKTVYRYGGGKLLWEQRLFGTVPMRTIRYLWSLDRLIGVEINSSAYFFRYDAQGNVIALLSAADATQRAEYAYDAWGVCMITSDTTQGLVGAINPIRYRGYYWDSDMKLYRLGKRLYDPEVGRFLQPDDGAYADLTVPFGLNMYAYCLNDPVNFADPTGHMPEWGWWVLGGLVVLASLAAVIVTAGSASGAVTAIWSAALGIAYGSAAVTIASFAFVGLATVFVGALAYNALNIVTARLRGSTYGEALGTMMSMGDDVFFMMLSFGVSSGIAGYVSYVDQLKGLGHSWSTERRNYMAKHPEASGMVLHHPYGRHGANIGIYYPVTSEEHKAIHSQLGYGTGQGGFWQYRPWFNWWDWLSGGF